MPTSHFHHRSITRLLQSSPPTSANIRQLNECKYLIDIYMLNIDVWIQLFGFRFNPLLSPLTLLPTDMSHSCHLSYLQFLPSILSHPWPLLPSASHPLRFPPTLLPIPAASHPQKGGSFLNFFFKSDYLLYKKWHMHATMNSRDCGFFIPKTN